MVNKDVYYAYEKNYIYISTCSCAYGVKFVKVVFLSFWLVKTEWQTLRR